jgi:hypothetical protein
MKENISQPNKSLNMAEAIIIIPIFVLNKPISIKILAITGNADIERAVPKNIANKIARNSDSEENLSINLDKQIILQIAITIAAFLMFFWTIPDFFLNLKNYLGLIINEMPTKEFDTSVIILSAFKIVISVLSITYSQKLSSFLSKKQV